MQNWLRILPAIALSLGLLSAAPEPASLFDGKTLEGWDYNPQMWRVTDGLMQAGSSTAKVKKNDFISTKKSYQNFELTLTIRCQGDFNTGLINSGIQIRSYRQPNGHLLGYQVDCGKDWFGKIYDEGRGRKVLATPVDAEALNQAVDIFGWNDYRILAEGPRIQVWINGVKATDYTEKNPNVPLNGVIAPQIHSGGHCVVEVKDIQIKELPPTPNAPTWQSLGGPEKALNLLKKKKPAQPTAKTLPPLRPKKDITQYNGQGEARSAMEQAKMFTLPEGYEIELVAQESSGIGKFVSVYFDQRGQLWTQTALEYPVDGKENAAQANALYKSKGKDKILVYSREDVNGALPKEGLSNPTVFAEGLAMPLGILPWSDGDVCYALHGPDLVKLSDTNDDGKSDTREVILTGFGVQDSHLFPHQFTRAPGDWFWLAQGLYNTSKVKKPGEEETIPFDKCSMARMRRDGSEFEVTSTGPNNIWGLAITGEGETFIQEANDFGHSVVEFHDYAYYPGGMKAYRKSYQPEIPSVDFRLGGTGLSGLAILENGPFVSTETDKTMLLANAITGAINTVGMTRDGSFWKYEKLSDFITCADPLFRPIALTPGPDGCLYIIDWYNKVISHNEVPRNHPDRDKTRGRIWRVKPSNASEHLPVPDFTKQSDETLISYLGEHPTSRAHLAWQTLADRGADVTSVFTDTTASDAKKIQAFWTLSADKRTAALSLAKSQNRNVRRELARYPEFVELFLEDPDHEVRFATIQTLAKQLPENSHKIFTQLLAFAKPSIKNPERTRSSRSPKMIPIREGYAREFERYLVRLFLEKHPTLVSQFLSSDAAKSLPIEARILATLSMPPKVASTQIGGLLSSLERAPNTEEILLLAQFPEAPGIKEAISELLSSPETAPSVVKTLLDRQSTLKPKDVSSFLTPAVRKMLTGSQATEGARLIGAFKLGALTPDLNTLLQSPSTPEATVLSALEALRLLQEGDVELLAKLFANPASPAIEEKALLALVESKSPAATTKVIATLPSLGVSQRRAAIAGLSSKKKGAKALIAAFIDGRLTEDTLEASTAERLSTVLAGTPELKGFMEKMGNSFGSILSLDGKASAWDDSKLTLEGAFTVEAWVRLSPGITNADSLLSNPGVFDINFSNSRLRVWAGRSLANVVISTKPMMADLWTHVAITRNEAGTFTLYTDGEIDAVSQKAAPTTYEGLSIGRSSPPKAGTQGALAEFRIWDIERTATEIRQDYARSFATGERPANLVTYNSGGDSWAKLGKGAAVVKTTHVPPLLTAEESAALAAKFAKYMELGLKGGNVENGQKLSAMCSACHLINGSGGEIGPNLNGAGAMGLEAVLRNIITPNAAMESGYRIFQVEYQNGNLLEAFFVSENKQAFVVRPVGGVDLRIPKKEVASTKYLRRSLMPEGLLDALDDEMAADLLAYLMTLK